MWDRGRLEEGLERMDRSYRGVLAEEPDADLAELAAQLGRFLFFAGDARRRAGAHRVRARHSRGPALPETFSAGAQYESDSAHLPRPQARGCCPPSLCPRGRARARQALGSAPRILQPLRHSEPGGPLRGGRGGRPRRSRLRTAGREPLPGALFLGQSYALFALGKWDELLDVGRANSRRTGCPIRQAYCERRGICVTVLVRQGDLDEAERVSDPLDDLATSADAQERAATPAARARLLLERGDAGRRFASHRSPSRRARGCGSAQEYVKEALVTAHRSGAVPERHRHEPRSSRHHRGPPSRKPAAVPSRPGSASPRPPCRSRR